MKILAGLASLFRRHAPAQIVEKIGLAPKKEALSVTEEAIYYAGEEKGNNPFKLPTPMPGVLPKGHLGMAADSSFGSAYSWAAQETAFGEGIMAFPYAYLSELTQRAEYRRPSEILAKEMTRKWIRLQSTGEEDKSDKVKAIETEMKRLGVQSAFRRAAELDGFFGRAHIYLDFNDWKEDETELRVPLYLSRNKIKKGSLKQLQIVEPIWTYPNDYNSTDPLNDTYYKPQSWFMMGKTIHSTRMLTIVSRPVPDLLKPAYQFGGLSLSQMEKPYVDNWLRTRQAVSDLIHSFSVSGLKTNMGSTLNAGAMQNIRRRIEIFNKHRDNRGAFIIDKDTEEWFNVTTPLTTLDALQAQSQEHMSSVTGIPLSILLGITPTGLNASSEGEIRTFYQWVEAMQEAVLTAPLNYLLVCIQLSLFGEVDADITCSWEPLWSESNKEKAEVHKMNAETDVALIDAGVLDPLESRKRLAAEEDSPYDGLDANDVPEPPEEPGLEGNLPGEEGGEEDPKGFNPLKQEQDEPAIEKPSVKDAPVEKPSAEKPDANAKGKK